MGILSAFRLSRATTDYLAGPTASIASPWSEGELQSVVWSDVFGTLENLPLTRIEALSIPAVAKGRNLLQATIPKLPLRALDENGVLAEQPEWLSRTDGLVSPWQRMAWTLEDLIFFGCSIWLVERDEAGYVTDADRCPPERWTVTNGTILIDGASVDSKDVLYIAGPHEGLLTLASRTLRGARDQETAWVGRVKNPIPAMELSASGDIDLTDPEVAAVVKAWSIARRNPDGAIGYTPAGIELKTHGQLSADLYTEGRNAVRGDVGSFLGIPTSMMDASLDKASLNYETADGKRSEYTDYSIPLWIEPIQQRLSMDDVVPPGQRIRFDLTDLIGAAPAATGAPTED